MSEYFLSIISDDARDWEKRLTVIVEEVKNYNGEPNGLCEHCSSIWANVSDITGRADNSQLKFFNIPAPDT